MDTREYLDAVGRDGALLVSAARDGLERPVPSCPGWVAADVVAHTGTVHRQVADRVRRGSASGRDVADVAAPGGPAVLPWFEEGLAQLEEVLGTADLERPVWNWSVTKPRTARFWPRRMAQETAVHRVDAEQATGSMHAIEARLAADGVDEFFEVFLPIDAGAFIGRGEAVGVRTTDEPTEWTVTAGPAGAIAERQSSAGAAAGLSGGASDVLLALWRRVSIDALEVSGDRELAARFARATDLA